MESTRPSSTIRDALKGLVGGLFGALIGGIVLLLWFDHTDGYVVMTTVVVALAAAVGAGIGYSMRERIEYGSVCNFVILMIVLVSRSVDYAITTLTQIKITLRPRTATATYLPSRFLRSGLRPSLSHPSRADSRATASAPSPKGKPILDNDPRIVGCVIVPW